MRNLTVGAFLLIVVAALVIAFFVPQAAVEVREAERHPRVFSMGGRHGEPGHGGGRAARAQRQSPASLQRSSDDIHAPG